MGNSPSAGEPPAVNAAFAPILQAASKLESKKQSILTVVREAMKDPTRFTRENAHLIFLCGDTGGQSQYNICFSKESQKIIWGACSAPGSSISWHNFAAKRDVLLALIKADEKNLVGFDKVSFIMGASVSGLTLQAKWTAVMGNVEKFLDPDVQVA